MSNAAANESVIPRVDVETQARTLFADSTAWFASHWLQILIAVGVATGIVLILYALRGLGEKLCRRDTAGTGWPTIIGRAISRTGSFFIVMAAAKLVAGYADPPQAVASTINFLWTLAAVFQAAVWAREIVLGLIEHRTASESYHGEALANAMGIIRLLVTFALFAIALVVVLDNIGVNVTGLVAGLGVGGIAIGLAAQGIFADLFAALSILFDKPFKRGDSISYDSTSGSIEEVGLKSTRIRSFTGEEIIISNKNLLDKEIFNNTRREHRRAKIAIGVAYETPAETLRELPAMLKAIVEANDRTFVRAFFTGFGASTLDFQLEFDSPGPDYAAYVDGRTAVGAAIVERFAEKGIVLPYPTQTTYTAAPDGRLVMPYAEVQAVKDVPARSGQNTAKNL